MASNNSFPVKKAKIRKLTRDAYASAYVNEREQHINLQREHENLQMDHDSLKHEHGAMKRELNMFKARDAKQKKAKQAKKK